MNPLLEVVAGLHRYAFAVAVDLGTTSALLSGSLLVRRQGLRVTAFLDASLWVLAAALVGGRLGYVLLYWAEFASNPATVFHIWEGGLFLPGAITLGASSTPAKRSMNVLKARALTRIAIEYSPCSSFSSGSKFAASPDMSRIH